MNDISLTTKVKQSISVFTLIITATFVFTSSAFAQVKIGTNPTTINAANNLEVEASTAGRKTSIDKTTGKVTIADGSEGTAKILTSNATGLATWTTPAAQDAEVMFSGRLNVNQILPVATITKINFNLEFFDKGNNFDLTTDQLTAPTSGYYTINCGFTRSGTQQNSIAAFLYVNNVEGGEGNLWDDFIGAGNGYTISTTRLIHLNVGDVLDLRLRPNFVADGVGSAFFQIAKVSN
ncbi:hypothetical protein [Dyadobacter diqingensis]|uniref:hypothetical protein n=1 Tax=Dyadobacter diqingensis TaxID=2938121 RepID=UPI0020C1AB0C|nr:hypothetical protein [Dyadobacter diqingensis]